MNYIIRNQKQNLRMTQETETVLLQSRKTWKQVSYQIRFRHTNQLDGNAAARKICLGFRRKQTDELWVNFLLFHCSLKRVEMQICRHEGSRAPDRIFYGQNISWYGRLKQMLNCRSHSQLTFNMTHMSACPCSTLCSFTFDSFPLKCIPILHHHHHTFTHLITSTVAANKPKHQRRL